METINKIIVNCNINETEVIPLTASELKTLKEQADKKRDLDSALQAEAEAKAEAKTALLDKLGITAEEAALLLS
jgi:hypothetical protein